MNSPLEHGLGAWYTRVQIRDHAARTFDAEFDCEDFALRELFANATGGEPFLEDQLYVTVTGGEPVTEPKRHVKYPLPEAPLGSGVKVMVADIDRGSLSRLHTKLEDRWRAHDPKATTHVVTLRTADGDRVAYSDGSTLLQRKLEIELRDRTGAVLRSRTLHERMPKSIVSTYGSDGRGAGYNDGSATGFDMDRAAMLIRDLLTELSTGSIRTRTR